LDLENHQAPKDLFCERFYHIHLYYFQCPLCEYMSMWEYREKEREREGRQEEGR
jgi:hypothetical protein